MINVKKILALILSAAMLFLFVGCEKNNFNDTNDSNVSEISQDGSESNVDDSSSNDMFNLFNYESDDVFNIERVGLRSEKSAESVTYQFNFMSDGYRIKAYISIPLEIIDAQKPCKCIIYNRGGNSNLDSLKGSDTSFLCAAANRIVAACEIRGSNGSEGVDQFGGDDLHDVIKLIDICENSFSFIDMNDFCVVGVSRGGIMTYMAARQDKRIQKIIVASSISDLAQSYEEREDKMKETLINCIGGTPEEMPLEYEKRSALYWADEIKVPVLLIHSKNDPKANFETQAQKIYDKLKDTTSCTFITHDDDYHGIHKDDIQKIKEWLEDSQ